MIDLIQSNDSGAEFSCSVQLAIESILKKDNPCKCCGMKQVQKMLLNYLMQGQD